MKNIKVYARRLEVFSYLLLPVLVVRVLLKWFCDSVSGMDTLFFSYNGSAQPFESIKNLSEIPMLHRILGLLFDGASVALLIGGLVGIAQLMRCFQSGDIFSVRTTTLLHKISKLALCWAVYTPINYMLLSLVTTLHNPVGQRAISVSFGSNDIVNIFVFGFFMIILSLMQEACRLKQDQDLTV
jgi:hypothetical protein